MSSRADLATRLNEYESTLTDVEYEASSEVTNVAKQLAESLREYRNDLPGAEEVLRGLGLREKSVVAVMIVVGELPESPLAGGGSGGGLKLAADLVRAGVEAGARVIRDALAGEPELEACVVYGGDNLAAMITSSRQRTLLDHRGAPREFCMYTSRGSIGECGVRRCKVSSGLRPYDGDIRITPNDIMYYAGESIAWMWDNLPADRDVILDPANYPNYLKCTNHRRKDQRSRRSVPFTLILSVMQAYQTAQADSASLPPLEQVVGLRPETVPRMSAITDETTRNRGIQVFVGDHSTVNFTNVSTGVDRLDSQLEARVKASTREAAALIDAVLRQIADGFEEHVSMESHNLQEARKGLADLQAKLDRVNTEWASSPRVAPGSLGALETSAKRLLHMVTNPAESSAAKKSRRTKLNRLAR
jgi:hypothetical protein